MNAINKSLIEMYCSGEGNRKYGNKYKEIKEKANPDNHEWMRLRDKHRELQ